MSARSATAWIALFALLAVAGLRLMDDSPTGREPAQGAAPSTAASGRVERVVDGDTIVVDLAGATKKVRYIGVDTPESVKPGEAVECYGKQAAGFNRGLVQGRTVRLEFGSERQDRYGRLLAYVSVSGRSVNEALLRAGYARTLEIAPNTDRAARYRRIERAAQADGRGLWEMCAGR